MQPNHQKLIEKAYSSFNKRNIDEVLSLMHPDVVWPNGWEGGYVIGKDAVKEYWTRQWKEIDPTAEPIGVKEIENGKVEVDVHQVVKDYTCNILADEIVKHIYSIENDVIKSMEIEKGA